MNAAQNDTTSISFQPLSGAKNENPFAYLLHIDDFTILLDCGWSDSFDVTEIENIINKCGEIHAVLISHPCLENIGALPYLCQHKGLSAPVFATYPVVSLGSYLIYDHYCNKLEEGPFNLFNANDIKKTFGSITTMTYQQEKELAHGIVIIPYNSGRSIGGAVWRIIKGQKEVIYTNSICNKNDMHLDAFNTDIVSQWHPTLWIVDSRAGTEKPKKDMNIDSFMNDLIKKLQNGYKILIPSDGLARTLEILYQLNKKWTDYRLPFPIYFLSHSSKLIVNTVNQMSEWLSHKLEASAVETIEAQFELKHVKCIRDISEITNFQTSMIIFATSDTLERGNSRKIFLKYVGGQRGNGVYFTSREPKGSLAEKLRMDNTHRVITLTERYRCPLVGDELLEYKRQKEMERVNEAVIASSDSDSDVDVDDESDDDKNTNISVNTFNLMSKFQFHPLPVQQITDYGVAIQVADYTKGIQHAALIDENSLTAIGLNQTTDKSLIEEPEDYPCKFIENTIDFNFNASSMFYDFEARTDFFKLKDIIKKAPPSHIVIIGGSLESTMKLHDVLQDNLGNLSTIFTPNILETVHLSQDTSSMNINISRALYSSLEFKKYDEHNEVAYIDALLATDEISGIISAKPIEVSTPHHACFVGKIDMPLIREKLMQGGMKVTGEGELICGSRKVKVRQVSEDTLSIIGEMCVDFIKVRNLIQSLLPMV